MAPTRPSSTQRAKIDKNSLPSHAPHGSPLSQACPNTHITTVAIQTAPDVQSVTGKILAQVLGKAKLNCVRSPLAAFRVQKLVSGNAPLVLPYSALACLIQAIFGLQHLPLMLKNLHSLLTTLFLLAKGEKRASKQHKTALHAHTSGLMRIPNPPHKHLFRQSDSFATTNAYFSPPSRTISLNSERFN